MRGLAAPKDAEAKKPSFYIMRGKQIAGSPVADNKGVQFIYLSDGRLLSSANLVGNITDDSMINMLKTTEDFKKLVYAIGVSVEAEDMTQDVDFVFQMYGKTDMYNGGTNIKTTVKADGMERIIKLSECEWSEDDKEPGQIRFEFDKSGVQAIAAVRFFLNDGYTAPEPEEEKEVDFKSPVYVEMLDNAVMQTGNNIRIKKALEKARNGEDVTIAFIGGSITQGAGAVPINTKCYAYKTFEKFCNYVGKTTEENIHFIKAGIGGTPSELGMIRYERDILRYGAVTPDIVVVEFAVNDAGDETNGECYDSLVRKIYLAENKPAVMLGEDATVAENVNLLKDIVKKQRQLIAENVNPNVDEVPQMIALYKEVEQYFYGNNVEGDTIEGLKNYDELDNVICMLCEDNFGHMRTLPTEDIRYRKGGFGMYYHLDYHGGPISYEWVDSTPLSKVWEQMSMAYEYGIKDLWIVNVGDLKLHEVPLTYFMALAYDYDRWGYSNKDSYKEYTTFWAKKNFPSADDEIVCDIVKVFTDYIKINSLRRPEAFNENIYSAYVDCEADNMITKAKDLLKLADIVYKKLSDPDKDAYYSMVNFSAKASMNLLLLHLYAAKNRHYAEQGRPIANKYADLVAECINKDKDLIKEFAEFKNGKWNGMQLAPHIGFTKWNEDGCKYPVICRVEPVSRPRMSVSRSDSKDIACKNYGEPSTIVVDDFMYPDSDDVVIEIANDGCGTFKYHIEAENGNIPEWLKVSSIDGEVSDIVNIVLHCDYSKIKEQNVLEASDKEYARLLINDGDTCVAVNVYARNIVGKNLPAMTFMPAKKAIIIGAEHFCDKKDTNTGRFEIIKEYRRLRLEH